MRSPIDWEVVDLRSLRAGIFLVVALLITGCGATGVAQLPPITSSYADPVGDADLTTAGTDYDVTRMVSRRLDNSPFGSYDTLQIELTFNQPVVLPAAGADPDAAGTQLAPYIGFDIDQNTSTGIGVLNCTPFGGSGGSGQWRGIEFYVAADAGAQQRLANGNFRVTNPADTTVGEATVSVSGNILTVNVPLSALGGDDGATYAFATLGTRAGAGYGYAYTDCAPNPTGAVITRGRPGTPLAPTERAR